MATATRSWLEAARVLADEGLIDYLSVALGGSSTRTAARAGSCRRRRSSTTPSAGFARTMKAAVSVPVIATGRIVDPADADAMIARGDCDACGMTRAMITDPAMPGRAAAGQPFTTCIGCNQGCIGHYHAGIPIACTINPWTGYRATLPRPTPDPARERWSSSAPARRRVRGRLRGRPRAPGGRVRARRGGRAVRCGWRCARPATPRSRGAWCARSRRWLARRGRAARGGRPASTRCWPSRPTA